jgi:hypothetical protein
MRICSFVEDLSLFHQDITSSCPSKYRMNLQSNLLTKKGMLQC